MSNLLLGFYGDDFTGSTDAMDALSRFGISTVLFLTSPDPDDEHLLEGAQAVGIAGTSRSMSPEKMESELKPAFNALVDIGVPLVHYKICSTFDSSPTIGSIGKAIEIGIELFDNETVPLLPGAPPLGRYVAFGNMFAEYDGDIYRLDRHPTMSEHPITPMTESNLLQHLSEQTDKEMDLVNILELRRNPMDAYTDATESDPSIVFFDSVEDVDLGTIGEVIWETYSAETESQSASSFIVGSSGIEYALSNYWEQLGTVEGTADFGSLDPVEKTAVMSGSASPVTNTQIETALEAGFIGIRINTEKLAEPIECERECSRVIEAATSAICSGESVVMFTARGPDDSAIEATKRRAEEIDTAPDDLTKHIGTVQGKILQQLVAATELRRLCIAGGDTCGHVASELGIVALKTLYPLAAGSPVCRVLGCESGRLEIALKGGQLGGPDYFVKLRDGYPDNTKTT
jgi:uncharacterized protein YgbK (DUF1537 family)